MSKYNTILENATSIDQIDKAMGEITYNCFKGFISEIEAQELLTKFKVKKNSLLFLNENLMGSYQGLSIVVPPEVERNQGEDTTYFKVFRGKINNVHTDPCLRINFLKPTYAGNSSTSKHKNTLDTPLSKDEKEYLMYFFSHEYKVSNSPNKKREYDTMLDQYIAQRTQLYNKHYDIYSFACGAI